jgi:hypothetical protein
MALCQLRSNQSRQLNYSLRAMLEGTKRLSNQHATPVEKEAEGQEENWMSMHRNTEGSKRGWVN